MKTIADRVDQFGNTVKSRLAPAFDQIGVVYPPKRITLIGLKAEEKLPVWVSGTDKKWKHLKTYPILGMSGKLGPKLKEGDMQVPEGIYGLESLNPNSLYHLALRVADLDAVVAHLHAQEVATEPVRVDEYTGRRFTFFADPDDLPLELYEQ